MYAYTNICTPVYHIYHMAYIYIGYISGVRITTPFRSYGPAQYNSGLQAISKLGVQWGSDTLTTTQLALHHLSAKKHGVHLISFIYGFTTYRLKQITWEDSIPLIPCWWQSNYNSVLLGMYETISVYTYYW